jgi:soluble lytic murein transglycosylase-like protein
MSRVRTVALVVLALACLSWPRPEAPAADAPRPRREARAALPPSPAVEAVRARIARHAIGLTPREQNHLAAVIVREAARHGLPVELVIAVMHVESRFHAFARSDKGALGLMQVMPATGAEIAAGAGVDWHGPRTLFDPEQNVRLGVAYLAWLERRFDDLPAVLTAYNAGPGNVAGRLRRGESTDGRYARDVLTVYGARRPGS